MDTAFSNNVESITTNVESGSIPLTLGELTTKAYNANNDPYRDINRCLNYMRRMNLNER